MERIIDIDLHCHLDGSLSLDFIRKTLGMSITLEDIQVLDTCESLSEYLTKFDLPIQSLQSKENLQNAAFDFIKEVSKDGIKYIEVRFAPMFSVHENLSPSQVIESVLEGLKKGRENFQVESNVIVCAMRHHSLEMNLSMIKAAREFLDVGVCGADLAGDENSFPMKNFSALFQEVKKMEMPFTIHAGETGNPQNIKDAVEIGASRIGHGIAMRGNPQIQELVKKKSVGIEMCPISNLQTKASPMETYPLKEFLVNDLLATINTDNRTVSHTTIEKEEMFTRSHYGLSTEDLKKLRKNAIRIAFASDEIKHNLIVK